MPASPGQARGGFRGVTEKRRIVLHDQDIRHQTMRRWWNRFGPMFAGFNRRSSAAHTVALANRRDLREDQCEMHYHRRSAGAAMKEIGKQSCALFRTQMLTAASTTGARLAAKQRLQTWASRIFCKSAPHSV